MAARYFVWSGWDQRHRTEEQRLHIARVASPTTLAGPRVCIAVPSEPWEVVGFPVAEGPVAVQRGGRTSLLYAASHSLTDDDCLALLDLVGDEGGWLVYHTHREPGSGWDRQVRIAPCTWGPDGAMVITPDELAVPAQRKASSAVLRAC